MDKAHLHSRTFYVDKKQAQILGHLGSDGLDRLTKGRERRVQHFSENVLQCRKSALQIPGNILKKPVKLFLRKKCHNPLEKGRNEFSISFHQPG